MEFLNDGKQLYTKGNNAYLKYSINANTLEIISTFVDPSLRGLGVAEQLTRKIIEKAQTDNLKIIPTCSYAQNFFKKHLEFSHFLVGNKVITNNTTIPNGTKINKDKTGE
ncbi:MAG: N-acetyltransferase [Lactobacillaceae bacterium]|jgi:predicted GNAT family acetyltransferase|nr:N-acetyltransferase [Lactobacillaceae bacterium]